MRSNYLGISASVTRTPEGGAKIDLSEAEMWIRSRYWPFERSCHLRVGIDVGIGRISASTIVCKRGEVVSINQGIVREDSLISGSGKGTKPSSEPGSGSGVRADIARNGSHVINWFVDRRMCVNLRFSVGSVGLGRCNGGVQERLPGRCATHEGGALGKAGRLIFAASNGKVSGDAGCKGSSLGSLGVDEFNLVVLLNDVEGFVGFKVEATGPGGSKVVSRRN